MRLALANVLSTKLAELTYGQILDGLPTEQSLRDSFTYMKGHPVYELKHDRLCDGVVERVRQFRSDFEPSTLRFQDAVCVRARRLPVRLPVIHFREGLIEYRGSS